MKTPRKWILICGEEQLEITIGQIVPLINSNIKLNYSVNIFISTLQSWEAASIQNDNC